MQLAQRERGERERQAAGVQMGGRGRQRGGRVDHDWPRFRQIAGQLVTLGFYK